MIVRVHAMNSTCQDLNLKNISERLREERNRLNLKQKDIATICDMTQRSIVRWEQQATIPADKLMKLAEHGFNVYYILTGELTMNLQPNNVEQVILELPFDMKLDLLQKLALSLKEPKKKYREAPPDLAGQIEELGDIVHCIPETDWTLL